MSMKTTFQLLAVVFISTLVLNANSQSALGGYEQIQVLSNQSNSKSCRIYLDSDVDYTSNVTNSYTNISQSYIPDPKTPSPHLPAGCAFANLTFTSFFHGHSSNRVIPYTLPVHYNYESNGNLSSAFVNTTIKASVLAEINGTECLYLRENKNGYDQYLCSINYGGLPLYWVAYGSGSGSNFSFAAFNRGPSRWVTASNDVVKALSYGAIVNLNTSFPKVVADIYSSCGSKTKHLHSLQVLITVTASVNLSALIPAEFGSNISQAYVVIKQNKANSPGHYIVVESPLSAVKSGSLCWTLGITWNKVLPNLNYCANGCKVTFVFANKPNDIYVLKTNGIKTTSKLRR